MELSFSVRKPKPLSRGETAMSINARNVQTYAVVVELDGVVVATVEIPSRRPLQYVLAHPRSKYTAKLKGQMIANGCSHEQINFVLGLETEDGDEAEDKALDREDKTDGSHYMDDPRYLTS